MSQDAGPPSTLEASLDLFLNDTIMGWARDVEHPNEVVTVQLYLGHRRVSLHRADRLRPDLAAAGFGSGRHGFEIAVPPALSEEARRSGEPLALRIAQRPDVDLFRLDFDEALAVPPGQRDLLAHRLDAATFRGTTALRAPNPTRPGRRSSPMPNMSAAFGSSRTVSPPSASPPTSTISSAGTWTITTPHARRAGRRSAAQ